jgi:hypothetical protein
MSKSDPTTKQLYQSDPIRNESFCSEIRTDSDRICTPLFYIDTICRHACFSYSNSIISNRVRILTVYKSTFCSTRLYLKCRTLVNKADSCNSHQLWAASDFDASWWEVSRGNNQSILIKCRTTLVLVWPVHESWAENAHANTCLPTLINSHQLPCNSCSCLIGARDLRKLTLMQTLACQLSSTLMQL